MEEKIITMQAEALQKLSDAKTSEELEEVRIAYLGRKGLLPEIMKGMRDVPKEERSSVGQAANAFKESIQSALSEKKASLSCGDAKKGSSFDPTLPGMVHSRGSRHPVSLVIEEAVRIFGHLGFTVAEGPDIETGYRNFDALNTPDYHPSLSEQDTFWLSPELLLRTQTSPVQIRTMEQQEPPIRIVTPGRCYRRDTTDATHSANFHQIEGLYVDTDVSLADLKGTLAYFARQMMGPDVRVRFRPHFFPFTEPSVECDFSCHVCGGDGCRVCKSSGWIEIAGAGMVDPRVFSKVGYDPDTYCGYAFGMGIERIAMIKYGIPDIRMLYENDLRFLGQFR